MARVIVFMANGTEEIEALTVVDLLRRAKIDVLTSSIDGSKVIKGSHGIVVNTDTDIDDIDWDEAEMLVFPGGMPGTLNLGACDQLIGRIKEFDMLGKKLAAICAAPSVLGENGILIGKRAVCYPGFEEKLDGAILYTDSDVDCESSIPSVSVDGNIITSRGLGTAIDFSAAIIEALTDKETADAVLKKIIYI